MITVSIIVPNYNHAPYLRQRLDSIFQQTYKNYEVILLDDCSTDNSVDILKEYADNVKVSHLQINNKNSGSTFKQWKKGLKLAKGKYVWIAETDDYADSNFLSVAIDRLEKETDITLFFSQSDVVNEHGEFLYNNIKWTEKIKPNILEHDHLLSGQEYISEYMFDKTIIPNASAVVFKRDVALKYIDKILGYSMCGDWLFWSMLLTQGKVTFSKSSLNYFRKSTQSTRTHDTLAKKQKRLLEEFSVLEQFSNSDLFPIFKEAVLKARFLVTLDKWISIHKFTKIFSRIYWSPAKEYGLLKDLIVMSITIRLARN